MPDITSPNDDDHVRATLKSLVEAWRASGGSDRFATAEAWLENRQYVVDALDRLSGVGDLAGFTRSLGALPNPPPWYKQGANRTFLGTLADR
jgi:hypothetical protein